MSINNLDLAGRIEETPTRQTLERWRDQLNPLITQYNAGSSGTGTVTSVSVTTANGVSGSVATATTTPAISLTLGAITPSSVAASGTVTGSNLSGTNTGDQTISLTGEATGSGTGSFGVTLTNSAVIGKVLTGYTSGAGTVAATDSILQAIQKLNGNDATNANLTGPITSVGNATSIASQTGTGTKFVVDNTPTLITPNIGAATGTSLALSGAIGQIGGSAGASISAASGKTTIAGIGGSRNYAFTIDCESTNGSIVFGGSNFYRFNNTGTASDPSLVIENDATNRYPSIQLVPGGNWWFWYAGGSAVSDIPNKTAFYNGQVGGDYSMVWASTASSVNHFEVNNAVTTAGPVLSSSGSDTNIDMNFTPKGTGSVKLNGNTATTGTFTSTDTASGSTVMGAVNPSIDQTITAGYSTYVSDYMEITSSKFLDIGIESVVEVG